MAQKWLRSIDEITIKRKPLREILENHRAWIESGGQTGSMADLLRADLHRADLRFVDLRSANLRGADLWCAELSESNLSGANLRGANLRQANLSHALLEGTNLSWADPGGADLTGTDLSGAIVGRTKLKGTIGLHQAARVEMRKEQCFICHSRKDQGVADLLKYELETNGLRCWLFWEETRRGANGLWYKRLSSRQEEIIEMRSGLKDGKKHVLAEIGNMFGLTRERIRQIEAQALRKLRHFYNYDRLVLVCSEHSLNSGPVIREIERALQREDIEKKEILFPIRIDDYLFDKWDHPRKADGIAKVVGDFRGWKDQDQYSKNFDKLLKVLNRPQVDPS